MNPIACLECRKLSPFTCANHAPVARRPARWERSPGDPGAAFDTLVYSRAGEAPPVSCRCVFETGADGLPVRVGLRCEPCRRQLAVG